MPKALQPDPMVPRVALGPKPAPSSAKSGTAPSKACRATSGRPAPASASATSNGSASSFLPHAFRISIPPTPGFLVQLIKSTAIASLIGFVELTRAGQLMSSVTLQHLMIYPLVGPLCFPLTIASRRLEHLAGAHLGRQWPLQPQPPTTTPTALAPHQRKPGRFIAAATPTETARNHIAH